MARDHEIGSEPVPGYRIEKFLGSGAFGTVYRATAPGGTRVALKLIQLEGREGRKEFRAISLVKSIRHSHLVPIQALWLKSRSGRLLSDEEISGADFLQPNEASSLRGTLVSDAVAPEDDPPAELIIAMGLGDRSLFDLLEERGSAVPPEELLGYMEDAAKGIDFLNRPIHELGHGPVAIQHCDIKPQNIMLVGDSAQVCDFGLARAMGKSDVKQTLSLSGTPGYAAPELFDGRGPCGATDQYSLAVTYYELRTRMLPFREDLSPIQVIQVHLNGDLDFSALPLAERQVLRKATSSRGDDRYPSAVEFVRALRRAVDPSLRDTDITSTGSGDKADSPWRETFKPGTRVGLGYRLTAKLHAAATDVIWRAESPAGKQVAVVSVDLQHARRFIDFPALQRTELSHPSLSELEAIWLLDRDGNVVVEHTPEAFASESSVTLLLAGKLALKHLGQELAAAVAAGRGVEPFLIDRVLKQLAEGLDFLNARQHRLGDAAVRLLHQNIRPETVMLFGNSARLGNFLRIRAVPAEQAAVPEGYAQLDHPALPPEVLAGQLHKTSDQYQLAVLYWHLRLGRPFEGTPPRELDLSGLTPGEASAVGRATHTDPAQRFHNCGDFVNAVLDAAPESAAKRPEWMSETPINSEVARSPTPPAPPSSPTPGHGGTMIIPDSPDAWPPPDDPAPPGSRPPAPQTTSDPPATAPHVPTAQPRAWGGMLMLLLLVAAVGLGGWYLIDPDGVNRLVAATGLRLPVLPVEDPPRVPNGADTSETDPPDNGESTPPPPPPETETQRLLRRAAELQSAGDLPAAAELASRAVELGGPEVASAAGQLDGILSQALDEVRRLHREERPAEAAPHLALLEQYGDAAHPAWRTDPAVLQVRLIRGNELLNHRDIPAALREADWVLEHLRPDEHPAIRASACFLKGSCHYFTSNYEEAIQQFTQAEKLSWDQPVLYSRRGSARLQLAQLAEAEADLTEAINRRPEPDPLDLLDRGEARLRQAKARDAVGDFDRSIALDDARPEAYTLRAKAYQMLASSDPDEAERFRRLAVEDFGRAHLLEPNQPAHLIARGALYAAFLNQPDRAVEELTRAITLLERADTLDTPLLIQTLRLRAAAYELLNQPTEAQEDSQRAEELGTAG